jgi:aspartyl-tRNA(Asn)/glutamyl-tRNA(Gln) amidotransferase subunit C
MEITDAVIAKLADLSRLKFEGPERIKIKNDLERMLRFVDKLEEVDTTGISPLIYMTDEPLRLRKDEIGVELSQSQALINAPSKDSDYFKVPKVLDKA